MSKDKKKLYPAEFKESAVKLAIESGKVTQTAKELGINRNTMNSWIRERTSVKLNTLGKREIITDFDEIKKLKQELAQVTRERDLLKKATAYFAKDFT